MRLTTNVIFTLSTLIACAPSHAQIFKFTREEMIKYTANNPFERFEDAGFEVVDSRAYGWTGLQYLNIYQWLDFGYGDKHRWVRALGQLSDKASKSRVIHPALP